MSTRLLVFIFSVNLLSYSAAAGPKKGFLVEAVSTGAPATEKILTVQLQSDPVLKKLLGGSRYRVLSAKSQMHETRGLASQGTEQGIYSATIYDYTKNQFLVVEGKRQGSPQIKYQGDKGYLIPTIEEVEEAQEILRKDSTFGNELKSSRLKTFRTMPPLITPELHKGVKGRVLTMGLRDPKGKKLDEIIGINLNNKSIMRFEGRAPASARVASESCGVPDSGQPTVRSAEGQAKLVFRDPETNGILWAFTVVRPAASSESSGSAVEILNVEYKGKMFLTQAHIPVLNVKYDKDACGPFRDWQDEETNFVANGKEIAPGILMANEPPKTILDLNQDGGNFHGVAVSIEGDEIVLTSELQSGWYRYVPQWRFHKDGTLKARFSFTAVRNACVCNIHHHHVYWRFKLAGNTSVQERSNNLWTNISTEAKRFRTSPSVSWRALYAPEGNSKPSLTFVPGSQDNTATGDAYAVADAWFLKRQDGESSDGIASSGTPSQKTGISIDRFLNAESLQDTSVVVWYGAHFNHDILEGESHDDTGGHTVGPDLILTP